MCGIVGWIDFRRDLTTQGMVLDRMTASMRRRGPDSESTWPSKHAMLGHCRLSVIDIEGGGQPMLARRRPGAKPVVLLYNGEIYNFLDLRAELRCLGHSFTTNSDTEVLLRAFLEWGTGCVERLNGMYAFAVWDAEREELTLARDRLGVKPLYYHAYPGGLIFSSEPKGVFANPLYEPQLDEHYLPALLNPRLLPAGETPLTGLRQVAPAHIMTFGRDGGREYRYWRLVSREHEDDLKTTVNTVRELLEDTVRREMSADVPVCAMLSGGLDSSAVAALGMPLSRRPLPTFSIDFADSQRTFKQTALRPERDSPYAQEVARHLGTLHTEVVLDPDSVMANREVAMRARDLPSLGQFDSSMYLFFAAIRRQFKVALSGEAADEIFGGYPWFHDESLVNRDTFPWMGHGPRLSDCLAPDVRARIRPREQEREAYATLLAEVPKLDGETGMRSRMREVLYLSMQGPLALLLDRVDRMSMALGLEVRVPFCDHRLVEYLWNVPWEMKSSGGGEKGLLRAAVQDLLPDSVLHRRKSAYPAMFDNTYSQTIIDAALRLAEDRSSALFELLDAKRLRELAEGDTISVAWADTAHMLSPLLEADTWLRAYSISIK